MEGERKERDPISCDLVISIKHSTQKGIYEIALSDKEKLQFFQEVSETNSFSDTIKCLNEWIEKNFEKVEDIRLLCFGALALESILKGECSSRSIPFPPNPRFKTWVNLKEAYGQFYNKKKTIIKEIVKAFNLPPNSGFTAREEVTNLSLISSRMLQDGCDFSQWTKQLTESQTLPFPPAPSDLSKVKPQPFDYFVVLDFEATCKEHGRLEPQEIIEFPSLLINAKTLQIESSFQRFVKPEAHPKLTAFCTQLTGIQQEWVDNGINIRQALKEHSEWLRNLDLLPPSASPRFAFVTCGDWDLRSCLPRQAASQKFSVPTHYRQWVNIKKVFAAFFGCPIGDLTAMLGRLRLELEGRHHSGIDDCHNISRILQRLLQEGAVVNATGHN